MKILYKVIAGGYRQGIYQDKESAMQEANRLSYSYDKVIIRTVKGNGQPFQMADDIIVKQGIVSFRPMLYINGMNIAP